MNIESILLGIFLCTGMVSIFALIIGDIIQKVHRIKNIQSESDLMNILNRAIEREFTYKINFEYKIRNISVTRENVSDGTFKMEEEVNELVHNTIKSLGKNILNDLSYYYSLSSITEMVFKAHMLLMTEYIEKNKPKKKEYVEYRVTK